eukprot:1814841-Amphidinium_carterae.1
MVSTNYSNARPLGVRSQKKIERGDIECPPLQHMLTDSVPQESKPTTATILPKPTPTTAAKQYRYHVPC